MHKLKRVLALGAHPDDLELGCGATLAKLSDTGVSITALVFSEGRCGTAPEFDRAEETEAALKALGVASVVQYGFPDTLFHEHLNDLIKVIEGYVSELSPDRVYTMFDQDQHQDHRAVYQASSVACRKVPELISYETPSSHPNFTPTMYERVDGYIEQKIAALKIHASQSDRPYMDEETVRAAIRFRGLQIGLHATEGFFPYRLVY